MHCLEMKSWRDILAEDWNSVLRTQSDNPQSPVTQDAQQQNFPSGLCVHALKHEHSHRDTHTYTHK